MYAHVRSVPPRSRWWTALIVVLMAAVGIAEHGPPASRPVDGLRQTGEKPATGTQKTSKRDLSALPAAAQAQISATIGNDDPAYSVRPTERGFRVAPANHPVTADFTANGVEFSQHANRWGMSLRGYGYGETLQPASAVAPTADGNRVEYRRGAVTEWYVNGPLGVEQGFTLRHAPGKSSGEPLTLDLALSGNLAASVDSNRRALKLSKDGVVSLRYAGLAAWDADGRDLETWLDLSDSHLRIRVDDTHARYPVTIDPYVQAPTLDTGMPCDPSGVCDDGSMFTNFGYSVAISADSSTVVVGAPGKRFDNYTNHSGVAYIFVKPPDHTGGWSGGWGPNYFKAKLLVHLPSSSNLWFGESIDISGDGSTIVVGASIGVGAWVYVRPTQGWGSFPIQAPNAQLKVQSTPVSDSVTSFGESVSISGDGRTIAVGQPSYRVLDTYPGAAYLYFRPATGWPTTLTQAQRLMGVDGSSFGRSVALSHDGTTLVVGAPAWDEPVTEGHAYMFVRRSNTGSPDSYAPAARLSPSDSAVRDYFGASVSANGDGRIAVVGSPDDNAGRYGGAYVYSRPANGWGGPTTNLTESAKLTASDAASANATLGQAVEISIDGNTIVAGTAPKNYPSSALLYTYFFAMPAAGWATATESTKVIPWDSLGADWFGFATTLNSDASVAIIGAPNKEVDAYIFRGVAYVFTGAAATPKASVSPAGLTFDPRPINTTSSPKTVTLTNTGSGPLQVTNVAAPAPFSTTQQCLAASPLPPGASCSESVTFTPAVPGWFVANLTFTTNSNGVAGALDHVTLQGEGERIKTFATITSVSSNKVLVGQSVTVSFSITTEPGSPFQPNGPMYVQASTGESCMKSGPSGSCALTFGSPGDRTVTVRYDGDGNYLLPSVSQPVLIQVADFNLSASPASQTVSTKKATYTVTVNPAAGSKGTLSLTCSGGPANTTCSMSPNSINLSGGTATARATVMLPNRAPSGTYVITFTGTFGSATKSTGATLTVP